jgi:hypothetical protein
MPIAYAIQPERSLVLVKGWGIIAGEALIREQARLRADPRLRPQFRQLVDFRDTPDLDLTAEVIRHVAAQAPFAPDARRAIVTPSDVAFGQSRMYQLLSAAHEGTLQVFRDFDLALAHLELTGLRTEIVDALERLTAGG